MGNMLQLNENRLNSFHFEDESHLKETIKQLLGAVLTGETAKELVFRSEHSFRYIFNSITKTDSSYQFDVQKFQNLAYHLPTEELKTTFSEKLLPALDYQRRLDYSNYIPTKNDVYLTRNLISRNNISFPIQPVPKMIFYNRIGKAGSTTLKNWLNYYHNYFNFAGSSLVNGEDEHLSAEKEREFVRSLSLHYKRDQNLYERHVHYVDFEKYETAIDYELPVYINMMREPGHRYISQFYFWRSLNNAFGKEIRSQNTDILDCIVNMGDIYGCPKPNYQTLYFCGNSEVCKNPPDEQTYLLARKNILRQYAVVGTIERFDETKYLLQSAFPTYFPDGVVLFDKPIHSKRTTYEHPAPEIYFLASYLNFYDLLLYQLVNDIMDVQIRQLRYSPIN